MLMVGAGVVCALGAAAETGTSEAVAVAMDVARIAETSTGTRGATSHRSVPSTGVDFIFLVIWRLMLYGRGLF